MRVASEVAVARCSSRLASAKRGKRTILGCSVSLSEAEVHWREFFNSLKARGLGLPRMITSDAHEGLKAALAACFPGVPWQRCQPAITHRRGTHSYAPKGLGDGLHLANTYSGIHRHQGLLHAALTALIALDDLRLKEQAW